MRDGFSACGHGPLVVTLTVDARRPFGIPRPPRPASADGRRVYADHGMASIVGKRLFAPNGDPFQVGSPGIELRAARQPRSAA